jgi:hypothetical protein
MTDKTDKPAVIDRIAMASKRPEADPVVTAHSTVCDTPEAIERFRMIVCLSGLQLESKGIRTHRAVSCLAIARRDYGIKAKTAGDAHAKLEALMLERGIIRTRMLL